MKKGDIKKKSKNILSSILKFAFSIILGFLPSFIFVSLFVQYGSPFDNYIKFLSDIQSSWIAWIFAIIIAPLIYFIVKVVRSKNIKKVIKYKYPLLIFILAFVAVLILISVQLYLYTNFILRNDILVKLSADKDNIFFTNSSQEDVTFRISLTMNPFCSAQCNYEFLDLSNGQTIDKGSFNITTILSKTRKYDLDKDDVVLGQVLKRFEVSCKSKRTLLCYTREAESKRAVLITLNYELSEEDISFKNESKENITSLWNSLYKAKYLIDESRENIDSINNSFSTENYISYMNNLSSSFTELDQAFGNLIELWEMQNFGSLKKQLPAFETQIKNLSINSIGLDSNIISNISLYNNLTNNLESSRTLLLEISQMSIANSLCNEFNNLISDFNNAVEDFETESDLSEKAKISENISLNVKEFYDKVQVSSDDVSVCALGQTINNINLVEIEIVSVDNPIPRILFEEPSPTCCFEGICEKCCDDSCSGENYPVIFLHGHSINKALPADYSFDSFEDIKSNLVDEGYIDAGAMVISSADVKGGLWGKVNAPIIVTASYFFDAYKENNQETTIQSNVDNIDTYAIRLKDIVELVKYRTNKDKVVIIAHSMGGLVARRYIQIFGADSVDKAILITVPNHGVDDKIRDICFVLGPQATCNDLSKDSIFINKLNNAPTETVPTYNIIGKGCDMGDETGDGIIKNSSQYLDYATNYYFSGKCNELNFDFFHERIIYPDNYPEVYKLIKKILKGN